MVAMDAHVRPPPTEPAKSEFLRRNGLGPDCALDDVGVDLDAAVVEEQQQGRAMGSGVADRLGELRFAGDARQLALPEVEQRLHDGGGRRASRRLTRLAAAGRAPRPRRPTSSFICSTVARRDDRLAVGVEVEEPAPQVGPASGEPQAVGARSARELAISGIAVALQDAAKVAEMARRAVAGPAVLEPIGDHRRPGAAERRVVARIGPKPGRLGLASAGVQGRQRRLVGEDALAFADARQHESRQRLEVEADRAHPLRHQRAAEFDAVAGVDGFLAIERQAVGVFGDGDLRQQRLGRQAGLDDVLGRRRLQDRRGSLKAYFGRIVTMSRKRARTTSSRTLSSSPILTRSLPSKPGGIAGSTISSTRSRCEGKRGLSATACAAWRPPWRPAARSIASSPVSTSSNDEALLLVLVGAELFRTLAEAAAPKRLQDRRQPRDLGFRRRVASAEIADLRLQAQRLGLQGLARRSCWRSVRLEAFGASALRKRQRLELRQRRQEARRSARSCFESLAYSLMKVSHFQRFPSDSFHINRRSAAPELPPPGRASSRDLQPAP